MSDNPVCARCGGAERPLRIRKGVGKIVCAACWGEFEKLFGGAGISMDGWEQLHDKESDAARKDREDAEFREWQKAHNSKIVADSLGVPVSTAGPERRDDPQEAIKSLNDRLRQVISLSNERLAALDATRESLARVETERAAEHGRAEDLKAQLEKMKAYDCDAWRVLDTLKDENIKLRHELARERELGRSAIYMRDQKHTELAKMTQDRDNALEERDAELRDKERVIRERETALAELKAVEAEYQGLLRPKAMPEDVQREHLREAVNAQRAKIDRLLTENAALKTVIRDVANRFLELSHGSVSR